MSEIRKHFASLAGLAVGVAVLVAFIYLVGLSALEQVLLEVNPVLIIAMVALELIGFVFYATAWYLLIRAAGYHISFLTCQGISFASIFAGLTMPSGIFLEAARCVLGSRASGMKLGESGSTVILHRVLYIIGFLLCTAIALPLLILEGKIVPSSLYGLAVLPLISVIGLVMLLYVSLSPRRLKPLLDHLLVFIEPLFKLVRKEAQIGEKADEFLGDYNMGFRRMLSSRAKVLLSFVASLGDWGCSVVILWIVVVALGAQVSLLVIVVTMAIGKMIQMTPIAIPGMLGIYETAVTATLTLFAVPVAVAASAALLSRVVTSWLDLPITGVAAYHYGYKLLGKKMGSFDSATLPPA